MSYVTVKQLEEFTNKFPDGDATLPDQYLAAAIDKIKNYLGYDPEQKNYVTSRYGDGTDTLVLEAQPVIEINSVMENGQAVSDVTQFKAVKNYLTAHKKIFAKDVPYIVTYKAGYESVPAMIALTSLQIASLLWESAGGNLAVSSTSFSDAGTRVFNNFKIDRFLDQIEEYKIYNV